MDNKKQNCSSIDTQRRLLQAAGEEFAEHGFHSATIKKITERAGASIASVNYHFNDKAQLYAAVMTGIGEQAREIIPPSEDPQDDPETQFLRFVEHITRTMLGRPKESWKSVLIAREFAQPTPALDSLLCEVIAPINRRLSAIIATITERDPGDREVGLAVMSVMGQCAYTVQHRGHIGILHKQVGDDLPKELHASHIARFSLAGLACLR